MTHAESPPPAPPPERVTSMEQVLKRIEAAFWRRYHADPDMQRKLHGKDRLIQLDLGEGKGYTFHVLDGKMSAIHAGVDPKAKIVITTTEATLFAILNKELPALNAYLTKKVRVKASLGDILFAKSLLGW